MGTYTDADLGPVHVRVLSTARRFTARWKADGLHVTIPPTATQADYNRVMDEWKPRLLAIRPMQKAKYSNGYGYENDLVTVSVNESPLLSGGRVKCQIQRMPASRIYLRVAVPPGTDYGVAATSDVISKLLSRCAAKCCRDILVSEACAEAARLGLQGCITGYEIGHGRKRLGTCSSRGRIRLSHTLFFYPKELRRGIILHELAHLTHFDHSDAFNALWDSYLGYSHTILRRQMKSISLPIL